MRVMEIVSGTAVNGACVNCRDVVRMLHERGHEVTLVCRPKAWIQSQLAGSGVTVIESDLSRWPTDELRRIAKLARDRRIDVIHTHMSSANFFGVLLRQLYGSPACVATAHNRYIQLHWMFNDRVIAVSEATRRFHRKYNLVRDTRIDVVPNFIDERPFQNAADERPHIRGELQFDQDTFVLGVIGDVIPRKGMIHMVRAMPAVLSSHPDTQLLCVGYQQADYFEMVKAEAQRLGVDQHIVFAGPRSDVRRILAALDVYVLPSLEENMPLSILEAMASGLPVVSSAVGGIPECLQDGITGYLVPPADDQALADAIVNILGDAPRRRAFGLAGRQRIHERFSLTNSIERVEAVFTKAVA